MRYAIAAAAFAASAIAVPYNKRDVVTDVDIVYETTYVTVTAGDEPPPAPTTTVTTSATKPAHYGHTKHWWSSALPVTSASTSVESVAPTSEAPAPTSEAPAPSSQAPSPTSTYVAPSPTSTYVAPAPTSTSVYVSPTQYSAPASSSVAAAAPSDYAGKAVFHHNLHRANHSAPDIEWDSALAATAQKISDSCVYAHDTTTDNGGYGQNIAAGVEPDNITAIITDLFYNGEVNYFDGLYGQSQPSMDNFENWGHFSQIVWKATTHVGCATTHCTSGLANVGSDVSPYFTVCNYKSPGNYEGEYGDNVGSSLKKATVQWDASS